MGQENIMKVEKFSVSLSPALLKFVEEYKTAHECKSRSQVIEAALQLLRQQELEKAYHEANQETDPDWNNTTADGLSDESW
jgi:metal-responsive CopG/Arc/MetJ family transcriptional regulator